jgi:ferric-dicitrate binding protein FerR (iron transport regulator)
VKGEAFFNVVKHQPRPFVVMAGDRKVIAVGTSFVVRREDSSGSGFAVTLVEGRVAVEPSRDRMCCPMEMRRIEILARVNGCDSPGVNRIRWIRPTSTRSPRGNEAS